MRSSSEKSVGRTFTFAGYVALLPLRAMTVVVKSVEVRALRMIFPMLPLAFNGVSKW